MCGVGPVGGLRCSRLEGEKLFAFGPRASAEARPIGRTLGPLDQDGPPA
jgi:hypothetical protein